MALLLTLNFNDRIRLTWELNLLSPRNIYVKTDESCYGLFDLAMLLANYCENFPGKPAL